METGDNHDDEAYRMMAVWIVLIAACLLFWTWIAVQFMK